MNRDLHVNVIKRGTHETREKLIRSLNSVYRPMEDPLEGMALEFPHLFSEENIHNTYYIEEDGIPVSQASVYEWTCFLNGASISVISLGSVSTLETYRHRGLSTKIIRRIMEDKTDHGFSLMLVSGDIELYTKLNCVKAGLVFSTIVNSGPINGSWDCVKVSASDRLNHTDNYHTIYSREPYRYLRTPELSSLLINALWFKRLTHKMDLFEISREGVILSYVVVYSSISDKKGSVMEYAGDRGAILDCLPVIAQNMGWESVKMHVHPDDFSFIQLIQENSLTMESEASQGTMVVLNWENLVREINPIIMEKTGSPISIREGPGERWVITSGKRSISVNGIDQLTSLIFSNSEESLKVPLMFTDDLSYI